MAEVNNNFDREFINGLFDALYQIEGNNNKIYVRTIFKVFNITNTDSYKEVYNNKQKVCELCLKTIPKLIPYAYLTEFPQEYVDQKKSENVTGLYDGKTLFRLDKDGNYVANYEESMDLLEYFFPKDKTIFIMCGAGGYANFTKQMLVALGWDKEKIYNVGGFWSYNGKHAISTKVKGSKKCDFSKVPYHNIDFSRLTEVK